MENQLKQKRKLKQKLTHKYRLVILNDDTYEERISLKLSVLNVFVVGGVFSFLLILVTTFFITFTPIKEFIPGYGSTELRIKATKLTLQTDSLKRKLAVIEDYTRVLKPVLLGTIKAENIDTMLRGIGRTILNEKSLFASKEDSLFREKIESEDRFPIINSEKSVVKIVFFAPLNGTISQDFNPKIKHFAVDIVAKKNTPVKATADGTVIFSGWTTETGNVIIIKHADDFISVYKHNGNLLRGEGDFVKSGEVIASVGSTGEFTTGPHLHFELWNGSYAVNPRNLIDFR
ncbi:MAG: M23 family metallopeptidase [Flavobacteriia bacterium]|nr:M23 family metallopeptidase [Flavobacteriia bacterium]OIP45840.1 MAG: peptidase M23 [Flavobacteriaceae bacterium CG2_30_31_66]PIV96390.1 MAG: peptidase M23 [Flavobacteriaceae bacterium CG17_big_fil_post_rev_8_21_14_2_50_31_13]PIX15136.1 MAG: peptidase M23 [Flavobacteriaceae bacterium CG_4_8_14_3_um_filter_31_8]PIY13777.1 MAG: peptidase M23 [Flavobacteriaceae bacterium CG_4_10_14_3_um_filter_31_253]PIZ09789.1 MAG: peptidase M23 [Flavobacteriaceae bacterium CG_4_10_14_0_8_um_filter_31_99]PJC